MVIRNLQSSSFESPHGPLTAGRTPQWSARIVAGLRARIKVVDVESANPDVLTALLCG
jgi:hypothetical protein